MRRTRKNQSKKLPQSLLQRAILKLLRRRPNKRYGPRHIIQKLNIKNTKDSVKIALHILASKNKVVRDKEERYSIHPHHSTDESSSNRIEAKGIIDIVSTGSAYVKVSGQPKDIYIPKKHLNGALHRDEVLIEAFGGYGRRRLEGKVLNVTKRYRSSFVGTFQDFKKYGYVFVEDSKHFFEVKILPENFNNAENGAVVIVEVYDFGKNKLQQLYGKITNILNREEKNDFDMKSILIKHGFNIAFPETVNEECNILEEKSSEKDSSDREDFRRKVTFTIDPKDARDFDDAISIHKLENGFIEVGVHIADVTHYVKEESDIDREAFRRSTSVYLVSQVCPMLPEILSNELCSLKPDEDKFCFSVIFSIDGNKKITHRRFAKTIIHSNRRFTYEEVQHILDSHSGDYIEELNFLNDTAKELKEQRFRKGSINFESEEIKIELDENGFPLSITKKNRKDAHKLVEEFMLLANRAVAEHVGKVPSGVHLPFIYRIHDKPDPDKLQELALLASEFGISLNLDTPKNIAKSLNLLTNGEISEDLLSVLRPMAIRSMAKAVYSTDNIGHFGLGFTYYTHFTSPIRRYSDILSHRLLEDILIGKHKIKKENLEKQCLYISTKERSAIDAERESIKLKQVEFLASAIGETFDGIVRSIIDRGIFVELIESQADGFIGFQNMDEGFSIPPSRIKVIGIRTGRVLTIGDRIKVKLVQVNIEARQIDLALVEESKDEIEQVMNRGV